MLTIYTAPSCTSCKKAKTWLTYHNIPFQERNLIGDPLSAEEISRILEKCDDGVEGLISSRNRFVKTLGVDFEDLSLSAAHFKNVTSLATHFQQKKLVVFLKSVMMVWKGLFLAVIAL